MRNLFLALLLANLLFLAWQRWIAPPEVPAKDLRSAAAEPAIKTLATAGAPAAAASTTGAGARPPVPPDGRCIRLGPIAESATAESLRARLAAGAFDAAKVVEEGQIWVGHWVQLESVATREEADRIVAQLAAGGLPDAYVLQASPPFSISLGVFRDRARADTVAAAASRLGFRPQTTDRFRAGTQFWLSVVVPVGRELPLDELGRQTGEILRAEQVECPADLVGAARPIN